MTDTSSIRVIIFKDADLWIGQCLEYDIAAQAADLDTLRGRLIVAVDAEASATMEASGEAFKGIDPAPPEFHEMWARSAISFRNQSTTPGEHPVVVDFALAA